VKIENTTPPTTTQVFTVELTDQEIQQLKNELYLVYSQGNASVIVPKIWRLVGDLTGALAPGQ
jgi:hypothetical protein